MKTKKRYNLDRKWRILLGVFAILSVGVSWLLPVIAAARYGEINVINYSATLTFIGALLIVVAREHSEAVVIGVAINPLVGLFQGLFHHSFWWPNLVAVVFSVFIIITLYKSVNKTIIKVVSLLYFALIVFLAVQELMSLLPIIKANEIDIFVTLSGYLSQMFVILVFILARYEDAEEHGMARAVCISACITSISLTFMHAIMFGLCVSMLEGHAYGSPDKYGDYARGLYGYEVRALDGTLPNLLLILGIMIVLQIVCTPLIRPLLKQKEDASARKNPSKASPEGVFILLRVFIVICAIGTAWVAISYRMYH